ncbi:MAG: sugar ABC transporter permease [Spirochaetota bacterium]|nr:sugar ABC transporter permease [Spirochaetota bacterium]
MRKKSVSYAKYGYIFSIPFVVTFLVFSLYPIIYTLVIGFTNLRGLGVKEFHFLRTAEGNLDLFGNFRTVLNNKTFTTSLKNTIILWTANFIPQISMALLLTAWFTNRNFKVKGQGAYKILIYMPNIITAATIAILFNSLFGYPKGPVNDLLMKLHIIDGPRNFSLQRWTARGIVSFIQFWMWYGNTMIVLIAGVLGINPSLFEAAEIDGATPTQIFFRVTLPLLRTILLYVLVTSMIGGLQMFDIPKLFLNGGPDQATVTSSMFIHDQAFSGSYLYNRASAASIIVFGIIIVLSIILFQVLRDKDEVARRKYRRAQNRAARKGVNA